MSTPSSGIVHHHCLPLALARRVLAFAAEESVAPAAVLLAAFEILLQRHAVQGESAFGFSAGTARYVATAPTQLDPCDPCRDVVARAEEKLSSAAAGHPPVAVEFVLDASVGNLAGEVRYAEPVDAESIARIVARFETLLEAMCQAPDAGVGQVGILPEAERRRVLVEWNATAHAVGEVRTVHGMIEAQAARTPHAVAVEFEGRRLTYRELEARANRVAHWLLGRGVAREERVAVEIERSEDMLSAVLGVMKAGCAYVPVDAKLPEDRKRFMKEDAGVKLVLDDVALAEALASRGEVARPVIEVRPEHLAYVLYTSGSTGRPKGVMVEHRSVANLLVSLAHEPGVSPDETTLSLTTLSFDVSVAEIFLPLAYGAKLVVGSREASRDPRLIAEILEKTGARTFGATPTTWRMMVDSGWRPSADMELHACGEALPRELADPLVERGATLWNLYGPTETTVYASGVEVRPGRITVGRPLRNTQFYIVDELMQPVPIGVPGELCIGGDGVARGYLNRPELTAEKFVDDPFAGRPGARMYRTGDLARWLPTGEVDCLGRLDHQVKIRGFRIELGEIESVLSGAANVREAVVLAREDTPGDKRLVAYVVAAAGATLDVDALRTELGRALPEYMVPSAFVVLDAMPMTTSGKADRNALPKPDFAAAAAEYVAPSGEVEESVAAAFCQLLRLERVGALDDFFDLGGDSLSANRLSGRVHARFGVRPSIREIFEARTPRAISAAIAAIAANAGTHALAAIPRVDRALPMPLSSQEARLWFLHRLEPQAPTYNECAALRVRGALDGAALAAALTRLEERHEALRTRYVESGDGPVRIVDAPGKAPPLVRLTAKDDAEAADRLREIARQPFDLARQSPWRPVVVDLPGDEHVVAIAVHHVATDEWSMHLFLRDLGRLYASERSSSAPELPELSFDYADWAAYERGSTNAEALDKGVAHFTRRLAGVEPVELPTDRARPAQQGFEGRKTPLLLPRVLRDALAALAREERTTVAVALLAILAALVHRHAHATRFAIAMPLAGRPRQDLDDVTGFFVNTVAIDFDFADAPTLRELLRRTREVVLDAQAHGDAPFERVVASLSQARDPSRAPLCQIAFAPQPPDAAIAAFADLPAARFPVDVGVAKFDLALFAVDQGDAIDVDVEYASALFDSATVARFVEHFGIFLDAATRTPDERVAKLPLMSDAERRRVLVEWNATARPLPAEPRIDVLFAEQVRRGPDRVALVMQGQTMTYRELDAQSSHLAHRLAALGVAPEVMVGISTTRGFELVVGLLAILKAGGAYVPLEPAYPAERIAFLASEAGVRFALDPRRELALPDGVMRVGDEASAVASAELVRGAPTDAAYVLFTSGSTGKPKGVCVEHRSVVRLVRSTDYATFREDDVFLMYAPLAFDASTLEIWGPLLNGGRLVIAPPGAVGVPELAEIIGRDGVDFLWLTSALFSQFVDHDVSALGSVRQLFTGGDVLSVPHVERVLRAVPGLRLVNGYGPTENTTFTTCHPIREVVPGKSIPIGKPIANTTTYVLDARLCPAPIGVIGELYTGGAGVARGYVGRPELTAEKFVSDPFAGTEGARLYRTGDLVRWLADGTLEFIGRADHQVKLRGFRIELGEIETTLSEHAGVREVVVVAREDIPGDKRLVAYVVWHGTAAVDEVRSLLSTKLPAYMIPSAFVSLAALPTTSNGQVDRKALPAPDSSALAAAEYVAPQTPTEEALAQIWAEVLRVERVGARDDFFRLGGHSLLATRVVSRVRSLLHVELPLRAVFDASVLSALAQRIDTQRGRPEHDQTLARVDRTKPVPASFAQARLWFLDQLEQGSATYNVPMVLRLEGAVDAGVLERVVQALVERHETLRTTFVAIAGEPHQVVHPSVEVRLARVAATSEDEAREAVAREVHAPFDLASGPLLRATLVRLRADAHVLVVCIHHIATDGWSSGVLLRELSALYGAFSAGKGSPLPAQAIDYADFAVWQRSWLTGDVLARQLAFWKEHLAGAPAALELPTDRPRPAVKQHHGDAIAFELPSAVGEGVRALCRREGATPFMVLLAAYQAVLSRWSGQEDVVVGTAIANRTSHAIEPVVGFFVNTLAMRTHVDGKAPFVEMLRGVKQAALSAYAHQDVPFEKLVEELKVVRDMSRTPIFQAFFVMQNAEIAPVEIAGLTVREESEGLAVAKFDVSLAFDEAGETFRGSLEFDTALFDRATMERFVEHLGVFLESATRTPHEPVAKLPLMTAAERRRVVVEWNATAQPFDESAVHHAFERRAAENPDAIAVRDGARQSTYAEVNRRANRLASALRRRGIGPDRRVATLFRRSEDMIVAALAVLKAGGAYAPLDPAHPPARTTFFVGDVGAVLVLSTRDVSSGIELGVEVVNLDDPRLVEELAREQEQDVPSPCAPQQAAYVIYTSGSTGQPKGALIGHRNLANLVAQHRRLMALVPTDRVSQMASPAFDATMNEIWPTLTCGAALEIVDDEARKSPIDLVRCLRDRAVTVAKMTTPMAELVLDEDWSRTSLRVLCTGGQALRRRPRGHEPFRLVNIYGPTEATDYVTCEDVEPGEHPVTTIGRPVQNTAIYILGDDQQPLPVGIYGEIYIGGANVGRGYVGRAALTADRYLPDPFGSQPGARIYRTGDRARWLADGRIEFAGRNDDQVKVRGYRIELGEIETVLGAAVGVREAAVVAREDAPGDQRLVAYLVASSGPKLDVDALRTELGRSLPDYMVPSVFVVLDALPKTTSGKVDRKALPKPDFAAAAVAYVAPSGEIEQAIADVFQQVLRVERVGVHDDFFALGGHSLLAMQVVSRIRTALAIELPVRTIFEASTVARLAQRARAISASTTPAVSIARVDRTKPVAASFAQARLWFLDQLEQGSATYNVPMVLRLDGAVDAGVLERVVQALVERHETLRTTFVAVEGEPHQVIHPSVEIRLTCVDAPSEAESRGAVARAVHAPFDLASGPLLRATLVRLRADAHVLVVCIHHIATDGWSSGVLLRELSALYGAFSAGNGSPLPAQAIDYADFAVWQRSWLTGEVLARQLAFWKEHLAGAPAALELPTDRPRPAVKQHHGDTIAFVLPRALAEGVRALCRREGATPFMVLLAAYQAVLSRWSGQRDIVVGTAIANRTSHAIEPVVGFFVNTLAMRTRVDDTASFVDVVRGVKQAALSAYAHQDVPFEKLVEELKVVRDMSRTPIFQAFFVMQNAETAPVGLAGVAVRQESPDLEVAKFDVSLAFDEGGGTFRGSLDFDTALFDRATMERFVEHLGVFLDAATRTPGERIAKLPLMSEAERRRVLLEWNATSHAVGDVRTVHGMIEAQAARTPDAVAVEFEGRRLTYRELDARANRVAHWLLARGVAREDRVAVEIERSEDMLSAVLGVMKSGCAYVPVDAKLPEDRKRFMKEDAGVKLVLDDATLAEALASQASSSRPAIEVLPEHLAYVLYTSGSTGRPKGVMVEHGSVANLLVSLALEPGVSSDETMLSLTTLSFDVSVAELFLPLAYGAKVVVGSREVSRDPKLIAEIIESTGARTFGATPTTWRMMVDSGWRPSAGMELHVAGEALPRDLADALVERGAVLWNLYGPTETTVYASGVEVRSGRITIGRPLRNTQLYIVDALMQPVPIGVPGELCIGGDGVARGYLGRPELTTEKFVDDPFASRPGARMYRTGDLARWLPTGEVDYLGRLDHQVKIRGFRIELGEIESVLSANANVRESVVLAREDTPGDKRLVAYVVASTGSTLDVDALRMELGRALPDYMVPNAFVVLEAMPMTTSGKLDRNALPKPDFASAAVAYVAPSGTIEQAIADVFQQVLRVDRVGMHDDFFALGGHSLLAMQVVSRIRTALAIELPVRMIFEDSTVTRLAERARAISASTTPAVSIARVDRTKPVPASFAQARLWFLDQLEQGGATYNVPMVLRLEGAVDAGVLERAVQALVARHETLRTTFAATEGEPHQIIHPSMEVGLTRVDAPSEEEAREAVAREVHAPFDLASGPLLRATLVRLRADAHVLVVCIHHIATDGWSNGVLLRELSALYGAFSEGQGSPLPAQAIDYADFAVWQRSWLTGDVLARQLAFWKAHLAGAPAALELPTDRPRPAVKQHHGDTIAFELPSAVGEGVRALCRREGATPFMVLLAAYQAVLSRWSGQEDVVVGTAIANRTSHAIEPVVGFFVNTLAMHASFDGKASFVDVVRGVKQTALSAYAHQDVPFEKLVEELKVVRDMSRTPIFQAFFVMQNAETAPVGLAGVAVHQESSDLAVAKFDVSLAFDEAGGSFRGSLDFDTALFDRATMERFVEHLGVFLDAATRTPGELVARLPLMTAAERRRVLIEWNGTAHALGEVRTVHGTIEAQTARTPDAVAVEFEGRQLTYRELEARANRVAHWLLARGVAREERVAVEIERSENMLSAVLGVMKAGCAYVPVDAKLPEDRKRFMKEDAGVKLVLDDATLAEALSRGESSRPAIEVLPEHLAYVLYTSGSTGRPKGVMVEHGSVANLLVSLAFEPGVSSDETMLSLTTLSFDVSVAELFLPLAYGAKVVVGSREVSRDPKLIAEIIESTGARTFGATPTTWRMMVDSGWRPSAGMELHVAGEALPRDLADALVERGAVLWNLYGPTETTVYASGVEVRSGRITIGRPLRNTQLYVVDALMQPVPIGVPGELCIGGDGVARGYLGRPELTKEKFVDDPFASRPGARMYRTGDLARWLPTGEVDYLGRLDHQVKIRGFRIELGEIESVLSGAANVREAVVLAREDTPGDKRLVAYVVASAGSTVDVDVLRTELGRALPEYMVPSAFVVLDAMPMTASGKVDRNALPKPDFASAAAPYVAPSGETEQAIADVFQQVLRVERVGVHDDFFALGGHSLLATQVVSRVRSLLGVELPVRILFEATTVSRLAARILAGSAVDHTPPVVRTEVVAGTVLSFWQESILEWERRRAKSYQWNRSIGVRLHGPLDARILPEAIRVVLRRQEALRLVVHRDPALASHLFDADGIDTPLLDMSGATEDEVDALCGAQASEPFALDGSPLVRFALVRRAADDHLLLLHWHQIVHDATNAELVVREVLESYAALVEQRAPRFSPLPYRYVDYAVWERTWFGGGAAGQVASARARLTGAPAMELPTDRRRSSGPTTEAVSTDFALDAAATERFSKLCHSAQATFFMGAAAVVGMMLGQWCASKDVTILSPVSTRTRDELKPLAGRFGNWIPLRIALDGEPSVREVFERARRNATAAYAHAAVPASLIYGSPDVFSHPLGRVVLNMPELDGTSEETTLDCGGLSAVPTAIGKPLRAVSDLVIVLSRRDKRIFAMIGGAADLFDADTIARVAARLKHLFETIELDARVSSLR